jgi:transcriptional regulator with GAF, ATPase, and Fis domain
LTGAAPISLTDSGRDAMKQNKSANDDLLRRTVADFERHIIVSALEQTGGNQSKAAMRLGTTKRMLAYRVRKYGIDLGRFCRKDDGHKGQKW